MYYSRAAPPTPLVCAGSAGQPYEPLEHEYRIDGFEEELARAHLFGDAASLCDKVLAEAAPLSLIVQVQAGFTDIAELISRHPELFERKVAAAIM